MNIDLLQCSICLDNFKNEVILICKHKFCRECIDQWLVENNDCPLCRQIIISKEVIIEKRYKHYKILLCCIVDIPFLMLAYYYFSTC